ncbi:hypothetical protein D6D29_10191 [Aureobasidium pullulans]|nr:hypothetical protein D6D29_10191 [Aureobasidium pullulans]
MIAEHPSKGGDLLFKIGACSSTHDALSKLLNATSKMASEATAGKPVKELKGVPIATDWREAEKRIRWLINDAWQVLKPAKDFSNLFIESSQPRGERTGWIVWATQLGLHGVGKTYQLALEDLYDNISNWRKALEWKKQADAIGYGATLHELEL